MAGNCVAEAVSAVVIDDHPAIRAGVAAWFAAADPPITVLATGATVKEALLAPGDAAQVVVLDLQLSAERTECYGELRRLADSGRGVVVYTMREDEGIALNCLELGALTFLTKAEGEQHLVAATHAAARHRPYVPPALAGAMAANSRRNRPHLSLREEEVLVKWFQSESKDLVADQLGIAVSTVNTYLDRVRLKYAAVGRQAPTKVALVMRAIQDGLIAVDEF
ncbi:response regulator [Allokutzneria sp. A3M-2-11 16]|uniref:DNA-binding response regulator n=1 Tax=Allokutzneria sp. A3M-2-11 16 TaxID=2962043 RepID=UPI0020B65008|nr:response regulator [Allokutzneria sp. A3M-2-11 16]MCP3803401.1 response regulator [Allokutzneria sp. A3M-2-11 16]